MRIWQTIIMTALMAVGGLVGCNSAPKELTVTDAVIRLSANPKAPSVAYFNVKGGATDDRLLMVTSPVVVRAELHESMTGGGMAGMKPLDAGVEIPAGGEARFAPGGMHVMLFDIDTQMQEGKTVLLNLTFASGLRLEAYAKVRKAGSAL